MDKDNTKWLKKYLSDNEFPSTKKFTNQELNEISIIIIHADKDLKFQKICLVQISQLVKSNLYPKRDYAMLFDRVALASGDKQKFGTQCPIINGKYVMPILLHSEKYTNYLRKKYNIIPHTLKEYLKWMNGDDSVLEKYL